MNSITQLATHVMDAATEIGMQAEQLGLQLPLDVRADIENELADAETTLARAKRLLAPYLSVSP